MDSATLQKIRALGGEGILNERDMAELGDATASVLTLMADGYWHSPAEIRFAAGLFKREASEGLRRLRELRRFFIIEKRRNPQGGREWAYRLAFRKEPVS